ncbi:replication initiator [Intrasporangium sp. YIM S08009]|uniref:replication initiator n=1 Tax=Intrasporangium zincisolvens TaxID=3080018 RepID=UPI002B059F90|nr:replication initiator [Intrasporangium sp. YIM S08009]
MTSTSEVSAPSDSLLGSAGLESAERRASGCARPVRLQGSRQLVNTETGEVQTLYSSSAELDGHTYVRCNNRRASVCPTCSREYKGDAWHLLMCGLAGGKGVPESVADRPCTFVTLTAPSFGAVHGVRDRGPCRARRDHPVCSHGRPMWCSKRHAPQDRQVGQPLCWECYDYLGHVLWQWHAPELWRRFTIALQRGLAKRAGLKVTHFRKACRISYSKVVEFQARGLVHVHAPIRLDGPAGPDGPACSLPLSVVDLEAAVTAAAAAVHLDSAPLADGTSFRLRWGAQADARTISDGAGRDSARCTKRVHPEQVAAYLAKYLTKTTEDFGLSSSVGSSVHARLLGATPHVVRIIKAAESLSLEGDEYARIADRYSTLGYRGHPITKSRLYSVTFGQIRRARRLFRSRPAALDPEADIREVLDEAPPEGFELVSSFVYVGRGYLQLDQAAEAVRSAAMARAL